MHVKPIPNIEAGGGINQPKDINRLQTRGYKILTNSYYKKCLPQTPTPRPMPCVSSYILYSFQNYLWNGTSVEILIVLFISVCRCEKMSKTSNRSRAIVPVLLLEQIYADWILSLLTYKIADV